MIKHSEEKSVRDEASFGLYAMGFFLSVVLTLAAYFLVKGYIGSNQTAFTRDFLLGATAGLAILQFFVQLFFFLHLGRETQPRWKLLVLGFMISVVLILVLGSLWIMSNLNYRMTPQQMNQYMQNQDGGV